MMKYVTAIIATLAVSVATMVLGRYIDYDMKFLAGWWSCMTWMMWTKD